MDSVGRVLSDPADSNELSAGWLLALSLRAGTATTTLELSTLVVRRLRVQAEAVNLVDVDLLIPDAVAVLVDPPERLVEEAGLGIALWHRPLEDVEPVLPHCDKCHRPRLVGAIGQVDLVAFDQILPVPEIVRDRRVALDELERRVDERAANVVYRIRRADRRERPAALPLTWLGAGRTFGLPLETLLLDAVVVDNGHRVVLLALVHRVDARGQHVAVLRHPRRLGDLRLAGKIDLEAVLRADELVPFLRGRSASDRQRDCEHDCRHAHGALSNWRVRKDPPYCLPAGASERTRPTVDPRRGSGCRRRRPGRGRLQRPDLAPGPGNRLPVRASDRRPSRDTRSSR